MGYSEVVSPLVAFVSILLVANVFVYREAQQVTGEIGGLNASLASVMSLGFAAVALGPLLSLLLIVGSNKLTQEPELMLWAIIICLGLSSYLLITSILLFTIVA
jgi:hypothetical protein